MLVSGNIQQLDFSLLQQRVQAQQNKASSKTRLQAEGALTVDEARAIQAAKTAKERRGRNPRLLWTMRNLRNC